MEKKNQNILWIIGGIILALLILNSYQKTTEISLKVYYYKNGVEVFPEKFSVITPPGGNYDAISFSISGTNMGNLDLTDVKIVGATPQAFKDALPATTQTLSKGEIKILWISNIMNTSQFESMAQPVRFWVNVSSKDILNNIISNEDYLDLSISKSCDDLIINSGITSLGGNLKYCSVYVAPGATLEIDSAIGYLNITATNITILGTINGNSKGYSGGGGGSAGGGGRWGESPTTEGGSPENGGIGGGPGGRGVYCGCGPVGGGGGASPIQTGTQTGRYEITYGAGAGGGGGGGQGYLGEYGSGGGGGDRGGGSIILKSPIIKISGVITMNGGNGGGGGSGGPFNGGCNYAGSGGGGGAGANAGQIILDGNFVDISSATLNAYGGGGGAGGSVGYGGCGGGGGNGNPGSSGNGGRIKIFYNSLNNVGVLTSVDGTTLGTVYYSQI